MHHVTYRGSPPDLWEAEAKLDLLKEIEDFLAGFYIAESMTLAIRAPESLDTLDGLVTNAFYPVPSGDIKPVDADSSPFDTAAFRRFYRVKCTNPGCCDTGDAFVS